MTTLATAPGSRLANFFHFRRDPLDFLLEVRDVAGIVALSSARAKPSYVLNDPACIREVLVSQEQAFVKGRSSKILGETLGEGLLTSEGDVHQQDRRIMQPSFHLLQVQKHAAAIVRLTASAVTLWTREAHEGQTTRLISEDLMGLTLKVIMQTMFADDRKAQESQLKAAVDECVRYSARKLYAPIAPPVSFPTSGQLRFRRAYQALDSYLQTRMQDAFEEVRQHPGEIGTGHLLDMLIRHLNESESATDSRIKVRDQLITILIAGHETTANALSWAIHLLSQNPETQTRLQDEIDRVLHGRPPTMQDMQKLAFTQQVIQETLRLYPTAWLLLREAREEVTLSGHSFRRQSVFLISPYAIHRSSEWFKDPLRFDPDRFAQGGPKGLPKYAYFPFGGGARSCIGQQFAMMEATLMMAMFAQAFTFHALGDGGMVRPEPSVSLRIASGLRVRVVPRLQ